jgi:hypothetical protein
MSGTNAPDFRFWYTPSAAFEATAIGYRRAFRLRQRVGRGRNPSRVHRAEAKEVGSRLLWYNVKRVLFPAFSRRLYGKPRILCHLCQVRLHTIARFGNSLCTDCSAGETKRMASVKRFEPREFRDHSHSEPIPPESYGKIATSSASMNTTSPFAG